MDIRHDLIDEPDAASQAFHSALVRYFTFATVKDFAHDNEVARVVVDLRSDGSVVLTAVR